MPLIGLTLDRSSHLLPAEKLSKLVRNIERLGFESVWLLDSFGREPFVACGFMLSQTSTLKVATGVATVYGRDPTGAVQALHALSEFYPGRFPTIQPRSPRPASSPRTGARAAAIG